MIGEEIQERIPYRGDKLLLVDRVPDEFGAGAWVTIDADGDGAFEESVAADAGGRYALRFDAPATTPGRDGLPTGSFTMVVRSADGARESEPLTFGTVQVASDNPAAAVPISLVTGEFFPPVEGSEYPEKIDTPICGCAACSDDALLGSSSTDGYAHSRTPSQHGVELGTGKLRQSVPVTSFGTRMLGFDFHLHHTSLTDYAGSWGQGVSHSFNTMIVQTGELTGVIVTADLRCYEISSEDGVAWDLPVGFFSTLELDTACRRWTLTHFSGLETEFYQGALGCPGYPLGLRDPNGNATTLGYDASGLLQWIRTDLDQLQTFAYGPDGLLDAFTDHIGRTWRFTHDAQGRLTQLEQPATETADVRAGEEITDADLPEVLALRPRVWSFGYADDAHPSHITSVMDPRGATPKGFRYDPLGRAEAARINGRDVRYFYEPTEDPEPLERLEPGNLVTRVIDREGNVTDHEIHGPAGGPVNGRGAFGLRRTVTFTERGKGNAPLRAGEPRYWEQRWLHDCDCLAPLVATQPFGSDAAAGFAFDATGIPTDWPRDVYSYNRNRQIVTHTYTDGSEEIIVRRAYQSGAFGRNGEFSRLVSETDPRAFDANPIYAGLNFEHRYLHDARGNRVRHDAPTVTRGMNAPQIVRETWTRNAFGQVVSHTDPNGNVTTYTYFGGPSDGGDVNSWGAFGGYLAAVTRGADGSADPATNLTTRYRVNPLGMTTREIDPKDFSYDTEYNDLQETTRRLEPPVTLRNGQQVRYETRWIRDGAGNVVLERRSNIDVDGSVPANAFIDRAMSYDAVGNLLSERAEVNDDDADDLVTRYAFDGNDDPIVARKPGGNREFRVYDERRLPFKRFYGVAAGLTLPSRPLPPPNDRIPPRPPRIPVRSGLGSVDLRDGVDDPLQPPPPLDRRRFLRDVAFDLNPVLTITAGYPADKRADTLRATAFVGLATDDYDARGNRVRHRDGRGNVTVRFFDFRNRQIAESDPNGNGWVREFDDDGNALTEERGAVSVATGEMVEVLERTYFRFDELGRGYQRVRDIDLASDERTRVDPDDGRNSSFLTAFDPGSRAVLRLDANGNPTRAEYDAADRPVVVTDALENQLRWSYDANSNVVALTEIEVPGPGATGAPESHLTTYVHDELDRLTEEHVRGLDGTSLDHASFTAYDSRGNIRFRQDAKGTVTLTTYDDADRPVRMQRFDGDPWTGTPTELLRHEWSHDRNDNVTEERALADVTDPNRVQVTRHAHDDLDRPIRTVYPDSDDPVGGGDGADGRPDRVEIAYDENSNPVRVRDPRGVVFATTFDPDDRPVDQRIALPAGVPGTTRQAFGYDALDRLTTASNDFARVELRYDPLSRLVSDEQSIRLDGNGFDRGWEQPIRGDHDYDRQSNRTAYRLLDGTATDLEVATGFGALNRVISVDAAYLGTPRHAIAAYAYHGPGRVRTKTLGNGARLTRSYDPKRRLRIQQWSGPTRMLVGFEYGYDRVDNARSERFTHDMGLFDHFRYNARHELTDVSYRVPGPLAPALPSDGFAYDDNLNRRRASFGAPFDPDPTTSDSYEVNRANELTRITRNGTAFPVSHDRAGNAIRFPVRPANLAPDRPDVLAEVRWNAFNLPFDIDPGGANPRQHYRYDPLRRRIATLELDGEAIGAGSWRYLYDGWNVVAKRRFDDGATRAAAPSTLECIHVHGPRVDEPLLSAIDRDGDGVLGDGKNAPDASTDQEHYLLGNRLGSVMALLDADDADRVLEYYRYTVYGEATVLPAVDRGGDGLEDTPLDLADNRAPGGERGPSVHGNVYLFAARRFDPVTGLYYLRNRFYDPRSGRFLSRDPLGYEDGMNLMQYAGNDPVNWTDPFGLSTLKKAKEELKDAVKKYNTTEKNKSGGGKKKTGKAFARSQEEVVEKATTCEKLFRKAEKVAKEKGDDAAEYAVKLSKLKKIKRLAKLGKRLSIPGLSIVIFLVLLPSEAKAKGGLGRALVDGGLDAIPVVGWIKFGGELVFGPLIPDAEPLLPPAPGDERPCLDPTRVKSCISGTAERSRPPLPPDPFRPRAIPRPNPFDEEGVQP